MRGQIFQGAPNLGPAKMGHHNNFFPTPERQLNPDPHHGLRQRLLDRQINSPKVRSGLTRPGRRIPPSLERSVLTVIVPYGALYHGSGTSRVDGFGVWSERFPCRPRPHTHHKHFGCSHSWLKMMRIDFAASPGCLVVGVRHGGSADRHRVHRLSQ